MNFLLDARCELGVLAEPAQKGSVHEDLGCGLQGPQSRAVRKALDPLRKRIQKLGEAKSLAEAAALVQWIEKQPAYDALCTTKKVKGRRVLKSAVLYGTGDLQPRVLHVRRATSGLDYRGFDHDVAPGTWPALHDFLSAISLGAPLRDVQRLAAQGGLTDLLDTLVEAGWAGEVEDDSVAEEAREEGLWFIGHNTVFVASKTTKVLVDPWFRPWRDADPPDYRALRPRDVGPVDAIVITHSHGDHFHLGSLLAFPRDTRIFVPFVERESILATDLEKRLREVGFTRVTSLRWWETAKVGDVDLQAMPFHGEQACAIDLVDPALRNIGNTWILRTPSVSAAFLADTGRDSSGSMLDVALEARRRWGPVDLVFGGMRGFSLPPLFLPFTTLDAMFVNVPLDLVHVRQKLMHDATDLLAVSEVFGARHAVPYADGGAPWYWREGMGPSYEGFPAYPGEKDAPAGDAEDPKSAPFPERLAEAAAARYGAVPLVESLLLRPGDLVRVDDGEVQVGQVEGFGWPYHDVDLEPAPA
jgi:L-ascorbate metabolism protein UlaG (beta-lactamase superfamily)